MMKWTLPQLRKMQYHANEFQETIDLSQYLPKDSDIISMSEVLVDGAFDIEDNTIFYFDLHIETTLIMLCAKTLKEVEVPLSFDVTEIFTEENSEEYRTIEGITIDLYPIIWSNIYLEKPMRVVHPDAQDDSSFEEETQATKTHPSFKELDKFKR